MIYIISTSHMISFTSNIFTMSAIPLRHLNGGSRVHVVPCPLLFARLLINFRNTVDSQAEICVDINYITRPRNRFPVGRDKFQFLDFLKIIDFLRFIFWRRNDERKYSFYQSIAHEVYYKKCF